MPLLQPSQPSKHEDRVMPFGKHVGKTLRDILQDDPRYLDWLMDADIRSPALKASIQYMNRTYSTEIARALD